MRIPTLIVLALVLAAAARQAPAQEPLPSGSIGAIDGVVGNDVLQLRYLRSSPFGGPNSDLDYGLLLSKNRDTVASVAMMFHADVSIVPRLSFGVGPQAYVSLLSDVKKSDVAALAVGANARYELIRSLGAAAIGSAFYSPGVLTFGNARNLYDFTAGAEVRFASRVTGMGGYRWFKYSIKDGPDYRVANEVFVGIRWVLE
jgi:hypothetical protein